MKTIYIRFKKNKFTKPTVFKTDVEFEVDFGKFAIGRSKADLLNIIEKQLDELRDYDIIKVEQRNFKKNMELLEGKLKKLSKNIDELNDNIDDLEAEKSDLQDEVYELEETIDKCDFETLYKEERTFE